VGISERRLKSLLQGCRREVDPVLMPTQFEAASVEHN
jgi:hypothetical protein